MKFDWNDVAMALLGAIFVVFGANLLSEGLFHSEKPEVAGYEIEGGKQVASAAPEETVIVDASFMMADVDPAEGQKVAKKCVACHNFGEGEANKVGPVLWDVVNRPIASIADFGYSGAMKTYGEGKVWTFAELNGFLYKPKDHVPGTSMGFNGVKKDEDRAELLAYLRTLSANPAPLPDPADAKPAAAEGETQGEAVEPAAPNDGAEGTDGAAANETDEEAAMPAGMSEGTSATESGTAVETAPATPADAQTSAPDTVVVEPAQPADAPAATDGVQAGDVRADGVQAGDKPVVDAPSMETPAVEAPAVGEPALNEPAVDGTGLKESGTKVITDTVKIITEPAATTEPLTEGAAGN